MITLDRLGFGWDALERAVGANRVRQRVHPDDTDLRIYNYTEHTAFTRDWDAVTLACRGLILNIATGEVLARPFPKFFNYREPGAAEIGLDEPVTVTDKLDGSLGILYRAPGEEYAIATRGSFTSTQAVAATQILREKYLPHNFNPFCTHLFEIILPENRIVVDYGAQRDLVLLGTVSNETGAIHGPEERPSLLRWPGPRATEFMIDNLHDALRTTPRPNAEGLVVRARDGRMLKVKQEDYVRLHRIVTGLNERAIWEHMGANDYSVRGLLADVPEEFHAFVEKTAADLMRRMRVIEAGARNDFDTVRSDLRDLKSRELVPEGQERRLFAEGAKRSDYTPLLFALLDGRDIRPMIWKTLRPAGELPEATRT